MRSSAFLLAASSCFVQAERLARTGQDPAGFGFGHRIPRPTGPVVPAHYAANGWTPKPTAGPGANSKEEVIMELLRRGPDYIRRQNTDTWENAETCGWFSGSACKSTGCVRDREMDSALLTIARKLLLGHVVVDQLVQQTRRMWWPASLAQTHRSSLSAWTTKPTPWVLAMG